MRTPRVENLTFPEFRLAGGAQKSILVSQLTVSHKSKCHKCPNQAKGEIGKILALKSDRGADADSPEPITGFEIQRWIRKSVRT